MDIAVFDNYSSLLGATIGHTVQERLLSSKVLFVRGQDEISVYEGRGSGRVLTLFEVYKAYGEEQFVRILSEIEERESAILVADRKEPANSLLCKRNILGIEKKDIAARLRMREEEIRNAEDARQRNPIRILERISQVLDVDDTSLSVKQNNIGDKKLGVRLKTTHENCKIRNSDILALSEAAWIIKTQSKLSSWVGVKSQFDVSKIEPDDYYGSRYMPAWKRGYELAVGTRKLFEFNPADSIDLKYLCENKLLIPVIQTKLSSDISGATIASEGKRGIVLNIEGQNQNPLVRRVTLAHELGHLLWDPDQRLMNLSIHSYGAMDKKFIEVEDKVEQRARAFAVEFLAPHEYFSDIISKDLSPKEMIRCLMDRYCISWSSAKLHLWNNADAAGVSIPWDIEVNEEDWSPSPECRASQNYTIDYFPLVETSPQRVGAFSSCVATAYLKGYISSDTAAHYLECTRENFEKSAESISELQ